MTNSEQRWMWRYVRDAAVDIRYALRTWARQPGFVIIAALSLACGIGLNTAVFGIINAIFLQSVRGVPAPDRIATIGARVPFTTYRAVRDAATTIEGVAAWQPVGVALRFHGSILRTVVPAVSEGYFSTLGVGAARGRMFEATTQQRPLPAAEVVLDHEFWTTVAGADPDVLGQQILVNRVPATIVGIAPRTFHGFGPERPPLWMTMGMLPAVRGEAARWEAPAESGWRMFGRLRPDATVAQADAELRVLAARSAEHFPDGPLAASTGAERWTGPVSAEKRIEFLLVVVLPLVVVGLILWIGCSNVANLLLARAAARRKEIAIRLASGASRSRLVRLLLVESLLLAGAGGLLGLLLAVWTLDVIWALVPEAPRLAVELDVHVLIYTMLVCITATLLFGLLPALHATRVDVAPLLKGGTTTPHADRRRSTRIRRFFLITQFASSMALLVMAGTFVRAIVAMHVGEQSRLMDHLAVASHGTDAASPGARAAEWRSLREHLRRLPGVSSVTLIPAEQAPHAVIAPEGASASAGTGQAQIARVDSAYFEVSGTTLLAGRLDIAAGVAALPEHAVLNERAARQLWGSTGIVGRRFSAGGGLPLVVAGVVRDDGAEARVFRALRDEDLAAANVLVRTSEPSDAMVEPLRTTMSSMAAEPGLVQVTTLRAASTGPLARLTSIAVAVAVLVLALATVGLYGAVSFVAAQRTREIAIRMAVGAPDSAVLRLVAREGALICAVGSAAGLLLVGIAFRFMSGMIFAKWSLEPVTVAGVLAVFSAATLAACYVPGRRATHMDAMAVLRAE